MKRKSRAEYLAEAILMTGAGGVGLAGMIVGWNAHDDIYRTFFLSSLVFLGLAAYDWYRWFRYDRIQWSEKDLRVLTRKECRNDALGSTANVLLWSLVAWLNVSRLLDIEMRMPGRYTDVSNVTILFIVMLMLVNVKQAVFAWLKYIRSGERDDLPDGSN